MVRYRWCHSCNNINKCDTVISIKEKNPVSYAAKAGSKVVDDINSISSTFMAEQSQEQTQTRSR